MSYPDSRRWVAKECRSVWQGDALGDPRVACGLLDRLLEGALMHVVPAPLAAALVHREPCGGEHPLPGPVARGAGILAFQGGRKVDFAETSLPVLFVAVPDLGP